MRLDAEDYISAVFGAALCLWISRRFYVVLGTYEKFESPWKRHLFLSPMYIVLALGAAFFIWAYLHPGPPL
jgi:branched-subunit amino acid transport protein